MTTSSSPALCEEVFGDSDNLRLFYPSSAAFYGLVLPLAACAIGLVIYRKFWPTASYKIYLYFAKGLLMTAELAATLHMMPSLVRLSYQPGSCASSMVMTDCAIVASVMLSEYLLDILMRTEAKGETKLVTLFHHGLSFFLVPYLYLRTYGSLEDGALISTILPLLLLICLQHTLMLPGIKTSHT